MLERSWFVLSACLWLGLASCGGGAKQGPKPESAGERDRAVTAAQGRVRSWIGGDLAAQLAVPLGSVGRILGRRIAADPDVIRAARKLGESLLSDKEIKADLAGLTDKATSGFSKKLSLGIKILQAGGPEAYANKVRSHTETVGMEAATKHLQNRVLTDERMIGLLERFGTTLDIASSFSRIAKDPTSSGVLSKRIDDEVRRLSEGRKSTEIPVQTEAWLKTCAGEAAPVLDRLVSDVAALPVVTRSVHGLCLEVISHRTTHRLVLGLIRALLKHQEVEKGLVGVYDAALFEKGEETIEKRLQQTLELPDVNDELFKTLSRLAASPGAGSMLAKHLGPASSDPALASLVERAVFAILDRCDAIPAEKLTPSR